MLHWLSASITRRCRTATSSTHINTSTSNEAPRSLLTTMVCVAFGLISFFVYTIFWAFASSVDCRETVNRAWSKYMVASLPPLVTPYDMKYMAVADVINQALRFELGWRSAPPVKLRLALAPKNVDRLVVPL